MSRRSEAKEKFPTVDAPTVDELFDRDPGRGAYGQWMVRRVAEGDDPEEVLRAVLGWHACRRRLPKDRRDLYAYRDVASVVRAAERAPRSRRRGAGEDPGYTLLAEYPEVSFYRVESYEGMVALGRDTKWCTTQREEWPSYEDNLFVVAVSRLRDPRDSYSKFVMMLRSSYTPMPLRFVKYETLSRKWQWAHTRAWDFYDASDRQAGGFWRSDDPSPLEEILDMLAGERGVTRSVLLAAQGNTDYQRIFDEHVVPFVRAGGRVCADRIVEVARVVAEHGLFSPLSLLTHPAARRRDVCRDVAALATDEHWATLGPDAIRDLVRAPAMNVPEIFDRVLAGGVGAHMDRRELAQLLIWNTKLTKKARARAVEYVRRDVFRL